MEDQELIEKGLQTYNDGEWTIEDLDPRNWVAAILGTGEKSEEQKLLYDKAETARKGLNTELQRQVPRMGYMLHRRQILGPDVTVP